MRDTYPIIARIEYYDYNQKKTFAQNLLVYGDSFMDVAKELENIYGDDLVGLSMHYVADAGCFFEVNDEMADTFLRTCGEYASPIEVPSTPPKKEDDF